MKSRLLVSVALMAVVFESGSASWFWGSSSKPEESLAEESFVSLPSAGEAGSSQAVPVAEPVAVAEPPPVVEQVKAEAAVVPVAVAEPKEKFEYAEGSLSKRKLGKTNKEEPVAAAAAQPEPTPVTESSTAATKTEGPAAQSVGLFGWLFGSAPAAPVAETQVEEPKAEAKEEEVKAESATPKPLSRKARRAAKQKEREAAKKVEEPVVAATPEPAPSSGGWFSFLWGSSNVATIQEEEQPAEEGECKEAAEGETSVAEALLSASEDASVECPSQQSQVRRRAGTVKSVELREQTLAAVQTVMQALCQDPECATYKFVKLSSRILKRIDDLAAAYALESVGAGPRFRVFRRTRMAPFEVDFAGTAALIAEDAAEMKKPNSQRAKSGKTRVRRFDAHSNQSQVVEKKLSDPTPGSPKDLPHAQKNLHRTQWGHLSRFAVPKRSGRHSRLEVDDLDLNDDDDSHSRSSYSLQEDPSEESEEWYDSEDDFYSGEEEDDAEFVKSLFRFEEPAKPARRPAPKRPTPYLDAVKRNLPGYAQEGKGKEEESEDEVYDISGLFAEPKRSRKADAGSEDEVYDISPLFSESAALPSKNSKRRQKKAAAASRK
jgi:hypothetical protein